jgi:hypothetical protein
MRIVRKDNGRSHWYVDADTDQKVDGVTTIVGNGLPKPALLNWAGDATAEYAIDRWEELSALSTSERLKKMKGGRYEKRDAASNKGTQIHKLAERLIAGERVTVPDALTGYVQSCVRFLDEFDVRAVHVEAVVYSETRRHVGTLDLIADVLIPEIPDYDHIERGEDGYARALLDWKTGRSGVFGDVAMQLSPYRFSEYLIQSDGEVIDMPPVDFCAGIHIRADGYTLVPLLCGEEQYRDYMYVAEVARIQAGLRDLVGQPIEPPTASRYVLAKADTEEEL